MPRFSRKKDTDSPSIGSLPGSEPENHGGACPREDGEAASAARRHRARPSRRTTLIVIATATVVIASLVGKAAWDHIQDDRAAYDAAHAEASVAFALTLPDYVAATDGKIPLHVNGTDLDGSPVDVEAYLAANGSGLSLKRGSYTATVSASPLMATGNLYDIPSSLNIAVDEGGVHDTATGSTPAITFSLADAAATTDEGIEASYDAAIAGGMSQTTAAAYRANALGKREAARSSAKLTSDEKAYAPVIEAYSSFEKSAGGNSSPYVNAAFSSAASTGGLSCAFDDINSDGIPELLVGRQGGDSGTLKASSYVLYDLYGLNGSTPQRLLNISPTVSATICADGVIRVSSVSDARTGACLFCRLGAGSAYPSEIDRFSWSAANGGGIAYTRTLDGIAAASSAAQFAATVSSHPEVGDIPWSQISALAS